MKKLFFKIIILIVVASAADSVYASQVDTIIINSKSMKKNIKAVIILPDVYKKSAELPVLYLLNGYTGNYSDYVKNAPEVKFLADEYSMIIVCPDGNYNSWYFDSPVDSSRKYETYVATELVNWIDAHYKVIKNVTGRAICGLSMGGHGALYLAIKHQNIFGAAGSMSGAVDIRPFSTMWELADRLGPYEKFPKRWNKNTVIMLIPLLKNSHLKLIIDCGTGDPFYKVNLNFHKQLLYKRIPHDFIIRPGAHNWEYWNNSLKYQVLFMSTFFRNAHKY